MDDEEETILQKAWGLVGPVGGALFILLNAVAVLDPNSAYNAGQ